MSAPRELTTWVSVDMYIVSGGWPARPSVRTFHPARWSRAVFRPTKFAMAPPDKTSPPAPSGNPNSSVANHRMRCSSISDAAGESCHPPTFALSPAASRSETAPGTVPAPEM